MFVQCHSDLTRLISDQANLVIEHFMNELLAFVRYWAAQLVEEIVNENLFS